MAIVLKSKVGKRDAPVTSPKTPIVKCLSSLEKFIVGTTIPVSFVCFVLGLTERVGGANVVTSGMHLWEPLEQKLVYRVIIGHESESET